MLQKQVLSCYRKAIKKANKKEDKEYPASFYAVINRKVLLCNKIYSKEASVRYTHTRIKKYEDRPYLFDQLVSKRKNAIKKYVLVGVYGK